ncbi:hypothetical protein [Lysobacter gummosus]|uniref:hypothetical protein n=1 Tax=Lysobacter gummosus TaxID=262324 RepID=UPI003636991B
MARLLDCSTARFRVFRSLLVIPAKAGIQRLQAFSHESRWIPAFAGMTDRRMALKSLDSRVRGNDGLGGWPHPPHPAIAPTAKPRSRKRRRPDSPDGGVEYAQIESVAAIRPGAPASAS